ncbi:Basal-body rod modification protein FlgD [compost metagenome]
MKSKGWNEKETQLPSQPELKVGVNTEMANEAVSTSNVWPNYSEQNVSRAAAAKKDTNGNAEMGKDQFLKILIAQLKNQDPMNPMEDKEFIAQMAQFSTVEQLMNINTQVTSLSQSLSIASSMIGKEITWIQAGAKDSITGEAAEGATKKGVVESIVMKDGKQYAVVGAAEVLLSEITSITANKGQASTNAASNSESESSDVSTTTEQGEES